MLHDMPLVATIAAAFVVALAFGFIAARFRVLPLVGYLLAGIALGPFTPGSLADTNLAAQLAEVGIVLLMFGVGLHFSFADLLKMRRVALPGAIAQITIATLIGAGLAIAWGWSVSAAIVFVCPCRSRAPWCCCRHSNNATPSTPPKATSRWAGSSSKTS